MFIGNIWTSKNNWNWNKTFIFSIKTVDTAYKIPNTMNVP